METRSGLSLRLFGPLEAQFNGTALPGLSEHRKAAQLLALLTLYPNKPVGNEWLAEQLWPGIGSLDNLRHTVADLRRALGLYTDRLIAHAGTLHLDCTDLDVDVLVFNAAWERRAQDRMALKEAVERYQGPLLQDWYEEWVERERSRYAAKYHEVLQQLATDSISRADFLEARRFLRRLVLVRDSAAVLHTRLMQALMAAQEYVEAKQFYEEYDTELLQQQSLHPPRKMTELYEQIPRVTTGFVPEFAPSLMQLEPVGGAIPLDSSFYVKRAEDEAFHAAIARRDGILLLRGPRQIGKTSLLARGLEQARQAGWRVVVTDFQRLGPADTETLEAFFLSIAQWIADQLDLDISPHTHWNEKLTASANFERFIKRQVLSASAAPLVWGVDEADSLFDRDYRGGVFGLFRAWYNARSLDPAGPWSRLVLILTYSTEAHLFIPNLHQSPFNVGTRIVLQDFSPEQVADLNERYGEPLCKEAEVARLCGLVGGHPYLVRRCLHEMKTRRIDLGLLEVEATQEDSMFGDHLDRLRLALLKDAGLLGAVRSLLDGEATLPSEAFARLQAAGVVMGPSADNVRFRCQLYKSYLQRHLR
ncbi:MAG TPA: AAA-like domain-containing protein [Chthonomonadaceae bacterium]|nr:AAA-like domain-containing protein [Chthonomonadaceae bacterium]